MNASRLLWSIIISLSLTGLINAAEFNNNNNDNKVSSVIIQELQSHVLNSFDKLERVLDTLGQSIASGASKLSCQNKETTRKGLIALRREIGVIKNSFTMYITAQQLYHLIQLNEAFIVMLLAALDVNFKNLSQLDIEKIGLSLSRSPEKINDDILIQYVQKNNKSLEKLAQLSEKIGLSNANCVYRNVRQFCNRFALYSIVEHLTVYSAFCCWCIYLTSDWRFDRLPCDWMKTIACSLKKKIGSPEFTTSNSFDSNRYAVVPAFDEFGNQIVLADGSPCFYPYSQNMKEYLLVSGAVPCLIKNIRKDQILLNEVLKDKMNIIKHSQVVTGGDSPKGLLNQFTDLFASIVVFDKSPMITIPVNSAFLAYFTRDFKKLGSVIRNVATRIDNKLYGITKSDEYANILTPTERFDQIIGRDDVKIELRRIVQYICNPDKFDRAGIKVERGFLLAGEPQTGKTLMVRALAGEISAELEKMGRKERIKLFEISTENLYKNGISYYMELAKQEAPCVIFIDELDLLRLQRDGDSRLLAEFLTEMNSRLTSDEKNHIILVAATNKAENVDYALRQHGRFGKLFWFDNPTYKNRIEFFSKEFEKRSMDSCSFDLAMIAQETEGCSFGTLDIVMKKALMLAKMNDETVTQSHFDHALDSEVKKIVLQKLDLPDEQLQRLAVHQAGKALISLLLNPDRLLVKVTIQKITQEFVEEHVVQRYYANTAKSSNAHVLNVEDKRVIRYGEIFSYHPYESALSVSQEELIKQCKIVIAGNIAQNIYGLKSCSFDKNDKNEALSYAKTIVLEGFDDAALSKVIGQEKLTAAYYLIQKYENEVHDLLFQNKSKLSIIVDALKKKQTLSRSELIDILDLKNNK